MRCFGLPIDTVLPQIVQTLRDRSSLLVTAEPGAGKSTVVPLALLDEPYVAGRRIVLLEPRVLAARAAARRMAALLGEKVGGTVGYRTRTETVCGPDARIEVVTEAVLTRMLQHDPSLERVGVVIFDEFHERSIHADLSLALTLDARAAFRDDLRVLVMSATLDIVSVAALLDDAPVISAPGRCFEVRTLYSAEHAALPLENRVANAVISALKAFPGDVLAFLPGEYEIRVAASKLASLLPPDAEAVPLYGSLSPAEQDRALAPHPESVRRVILATSVAETSLTIPGVRIVVDSGLRRIPRFSPATGMDRLETVRVTKAGADQRRGRAGRTAPGVCIRLWAEFEQNALEEFASPEILETDLAPLALELVKWGLREDSVSSLKWLDPPPSVKLAQAFAVLRRLGAVRGDSLTPHGDALLNFPLHPRLAHAALAGASFGPPGTAAFLAALLSDRDPVRNAPSRDLRDRLRLRSGAVPGSVDPLALDRIRRTSERIHPLLRGVRRAATAAPDDDLPGLLLAAAYPERIGRWREPHSGEYTLANGVTAYLDRNDPLALSEFLAVGETSTARGRTVIRLAAPLALDALERFQPGLIVSTTEIVWDEAHASAVREQIVSIGSVVLSRKRSGDRATSGEALPLLWDAIRRTGLVLLAFSPGVEAFRNRVCFLHAQGCDGFPDLSDAALLATLEEWLAPFAGESVKAADLRKLDFRHILEAAVPARALSAMNRLAPERMDVPSGSHVRIDYSDPNQPKVSVRLQELFGLTATPKLAGGRVPLLMDILSPAMRTVQKTSDLESFWKSSYFLVRKDMRGRYPRHDWPEDPLHALPHRGVRKPTAGGSR